MRKACLVLLFFFCASMLRAQYKVRFLVTSLPAYHQKMDPLFVAGSFNNWNPANPKYALNQDGSGGYAVDISLPAGRYEYKFTRGGWDKGESAGSAAGIDNRVLEVYSDTTVRVTIRDWSDHFPTTPRVSTANRHVTIIDTAFFIPQLNRTRRIWIYLPEGYATSGKRYPVMYMHDGQNVFDALYGFGGEWGVDEALDTLGPRVGECIVVGIDHGGDKRLNEYSPYDMAKYGKGEGDRYVDFLVKTLQPFMNRHYRTSRRAADTFVAGSSMGGLISLYAILKYPKKFGGAGVFSPAFWIAPAIRDAVSKRGKKVKGKIYFYAGTAESESMVPDMLDVFQRLHHVSKARMQTVIRSGGRHNEPTWQAEFPLFYQWMMKREK
ncbi:MAG: alpha/beta hydrolase [Flaviaesturariibacter sp.]|nr:alpha/beta hydrolase [Flaviaesturariibacter sp.]